MMYSYPHFMNMVGTGWAVIVVPLLLAIAAVTLITWWPSHQGGSGGSAAERTLDERFARGEIEAEEYEQRMRTLHTVHH